MDRTLQKKFEFLGIKSGHVLNVIILSVLAALTESFGLALILPILDFLQKGENVRDLVNESQVWPYIFDTFSFFQVKVSLYSLLLVAVLLLTMRSVIHYARNLYNAHLQQHMSHCARTNVISSYILMQFSRFQQDSTSSLINILANELPRATGSFYILLQLFSNLIMFLGLFSLLILLSPLLTLFAAVIIFSSGVIVLLLTKNTKRTSLNASAANKNFAEGFGQMFQLLKLVKLSATEKSVIRQITDDSNTIRSRFFDLAKYRAKIDLSIEPFIIIAGSMVLVYSIDFLKLGLSETGVFMLVLLRIMPIAKTVLQAVQAFSAAEGSRKMLFQAYFDATQFREENLGTDKLSAPSDITFDDVSFQYTQDIAALRGISLKFHAGKITALIGRAGAGKSTLIDLILRIYEPTHGRILINEKPLGSYDITDLRDNISFVTQDSYFLDASIRENITISGLKLSDKKILNELDRVFGNQFEQSFPKKLDTAMGFSGANLSGGQKQMIALCKAILEDRKIIVLDEPTSSLDLQSQKRVVELIRSLRNDNRIIIIVSHRPSTLSIADTIFILDHGKVSQSGSHKELLTKSDWYKTFFSNEKA